MRNLIFALLLITTNLSYADNRAWTTEEKEWAAAATVFSITDWLTTRNMSRRYNENYREQNPILGSHPTTAEVNRYFAITIPLVFIIADNLDEYRRPWLMTVTGIEAAVSANNLRIGLRLQF